MTPQEKAEFKAEIKAELREEFVFLPKTKLLHVIGGALATLGVASGITLGGIFLYLRSEDAEIARVRIESIRTQAEKHLKALETDSYVRVGSTVALESKVHPEKYFHVGSDKALSLVYGRSEPSNVHLHWLVRSTPKKK